MAVAREIVTSLSRLLTGSPATGHHPARDSDGQWQSLRENAVDVRLYGTLGTADDTDVVQAAYDDLPDYDSGAGQDGGGILEFPGDTVVSVSKIVLQRNKPIVVRTKGMSRRFARYDRWGRDAIIKGLDTGADSCIFEILEPATNVNGYGFQFLGVQFDLTEGTQFAIDAGAINHTIIRDCSVFSVASPGIAQWLCRGRIVSGQGDDCSWWKLVENVTSNVGLVKNGTVGLQQCNRWSMRYNTVFPGPDNEACIYLVGNDAPSTLNNNLEPGAYDAYGIYLNNVGRGCFIGDTGESSYSGSVFIKAESCNGNLFAPIGYSSVGSTDVLIEDDGVNIVIAPTMTGQGNNYGNAETTRLDHTGKYPQMGISAHGLLSATLASMPNHLMQGRYLLGLEPLDIVTNGLTAEYWDGAAWTAWAPSDLGNVAFANTDVLAVDVTHKKFRLYLGSTGAPDWPFLFCRFFRGSGSASGTIAMTVEALAGDLTTVQQTFTFDLTLDSVFEGFTFPLPSILGTYVRVTFDTPLTGAQTMSVGRIALYTSAASKTKSVPGNRFRGTASPEGAVKGIIGDTYQRLNGGSSTTLYTKASGTGTTGWQAVTNSIIGAKTHDWGSIADGARASTTVTVTGAVLGDSASAGMAVDLQGMEITAHVSAADTVTVVMRNGTGAPVDLASAALRVIVHKVV